MAKDRQNWLKVGTVGRPQGIKGAFYVSGRDQPFEQKYDQVVIGDDPSEAPLHKILSQKTQSGRSLLITDKLQDREAASHLNGKAIWVKREQVKLDNNKEYLWHDLIGKKVFDCNDLYVGEICDIQNYGASDVVFIKNKADQQASLPFVAHYFMMDFVATDERIELVVPSKTLEELWQ